MRYSYDSNLVEVARYFMVFHSGVTWGVYSESSWGRYSYSKIDKNSNSINNYKQLFPSWPAFTCSQSSIDIPEQSVKIVLS